MKIACISDTHTFCIPDADMPDADVLVHAGDLTNSGSVAALVAQAAWLERLSQEKYQDVIVIGGNHDYALDGFMKENAEYAVHEKIFNRRVHYLRDSGLAIGGKYFYGTPWTYDENWAFGEPVPLKRKRYWDMIPLHTNVLVTHCPPRGIRDIYHGNSLGCNELRQAVSRVKPQLHVFGHIHNCYGTYADANTTYVNAASTAVLGDHYVYCNKPIVIEI